MLRDPLTNVGWLAHITHIDNMESIVTNGILSHNRAHVEGLVDQDIADPDVNDRRANRLVSITNKPLHDYVPFYFNSRNPMLYRRKSIQDEIVTLVVSRYTLTWPGVIFTDGNAASSNTRFFSDLRDLDNLDWNCIRGDSWNNYPDGRRIRCAEVLIEDFLAFQYVRRIIVRTQQTRRALQQKVQVRQTIEVSPGWYFD